MAADLARPVCTLLHCRYPIVLAGMGGVARAELAGAVTAAGGFGFLGMVREPPALIEREVAALRDAGHTRFGVNLIPAATEPKLLEDEIAACIALQVPVVGLFWDISAAIIRRLRDAGILVVYQVGSLAEGVEAARAGAQILIAQGVEAGGHVRGTTPLVELLPALADAVAIPVLAAGGMTGGADLVTALALGGQGIVMGTAMLATRESFANDYHKLRLLEASASDTELTGMFHINWPEGARVRVLSSNVTRGLRGRSDPANPVIIAHEGGRPIYLFSTDSPLRNTAGDLAAMPLYAGMGVGQLQGIVSAGRRLQQVVDEAEALLRLQRAGGSDEQIAAAEANSPVCYAGQNPEYMGFLGHQALIEALEGLWTGLRREAIAHLQAAPDGHRGLHGADPRTLACVKWAVRLWSLIATHKGAPPALREPPADSAAELQALIPKIFEDDIRSRLTRLAADLAAAAPAEAAP